MKSHQAIIESALDLFYRQGFHATGVDQLSKAAGITKKTLYRHFSTKDALIHAALLCRHTFFIQKMKTHIEAKPRHERPSAYIDFIIAWTQEPDFNGCAFINATAEHPDHENEVHKIAAEHKKHVRHYLHQICVDAELSSPQHRAWQLFLIGESITTTAQISGMNNDLAAASRMMAASCLA